MFLSAPPFEGRRADDDRFDGQGGAPQHFADPVEGSPRQFADHQQVELAGAVASPACCAWKQAHS